MTQDATNQNTKNAYQNKAFNHLNQTDQFGNTLNYTQSGTDAQGNPIFGVNKSMGQTGQQFAGGFGGLGQQYFDMAGQGIGSSMDAMNKAYDSATAFSAPRQAREKEQMSTRLANMGLDPSSEAYKNQMMDVTEQQTNQQNSLAAALQGQMFNQSLAGRQQQMGELRPGVQFGMGAMNPNLVNTPGVGVQNVDVAGLNSQNYQQQMDAYKAKQAQQGAMLGGLGGMAGAALMAPMTGGGSLGGFLGGKLIGGLGGALSSTGGNANGVL